MLALPAEPGARGERLLHHRRGVGEELHLALGQRLHPRGQRLELRLEHVVIVGALRIDRDRAARRLSCRIASGIAGAPVIQSEQDDAVGFRPQRARGFAALGGGCEPRHVALPALGEKLAERIAGALNRVGRGEAHGVEAKRLGLSRRSFVSASLSSGSVIPAQAGIQGNLLGVLDSGYRLSPV